MGLIAAGAAAGLGVMTLALFIGCMAAVIIHHIKNSK